MNRKQFLKKSLQAGLCACGVRLGLEGGTKNPKVAVQQESKPESQEWIGDLEKRMIKGAETPAWRKMEKAGIWIKDVTKHMDAMLDEETKVKLMQACGRSCFIHTFGVAENKTPTKEERERYLKLLQSRGVEIQREGNVIRFTMSWGRNHQNPTGLVMSDGYCMCPQVESGPPGLSPTYCFCSTGYVKESLERVLGKPIKVELLDSLKMGGKDCVFKVELQDI
ncbi:MAG: hypothetical protein JXB26_16500 [Candidatus Aminicenantes bacterium]|nr:hypothetical protein [Candidatus Aminicenantes bacterium]